ncbi:anti-sigma factor domain-containing protein [Nonomuraea sp. NPDC050663]|uniref:anti-sigma factor n=1 Tax=Nonomuraea sp. NPDC050663 TaxID=3364370 RepID=UPI0037AD8460
MNENVHTLSGAYALDALPPDELRAFERHMNACPDCEHEVRSLRETAARLAASVELAPPPALKARVLSEVGRVRQAPPIVAAAPDRRPGLRGRLTASRVTAAVLALAAVLAGVLFLRAQDQLDAERATGERIAAVLAAPDSRRVSARVGEATATAIYSPQKASAVLVTAGMRALPPSQDYQLWLIGADEIRSAGLMPDDPAPVLATSIRAGDRLGITIEPRGGSRQPTTRPLAVLPLPSS